MGFVLIFLISKMTDSQCTYTKNQWQHCLIFPFICTMTDSVRGTVILQASTQGLEAQRWLANGMYTNAFTLITCFGSSSCGYLCHCHFFKSYARTHARTHTHTHTHNPDEVNSGVCVCVCIYMSVSLSWSTFSVFIGDDVYTTASSVWHLSLPFKRQPCLSEPGGLPFKGSHVCLSHWFHLFLFSSRTPIQK